MVLVNYTLRILDNTKAQNITGFQNVSEINLSKI